MHREEKLPTETVDTLNGPWAMGLGRESCINQSRAVDPNTTAHREQDVTLAEIRETWAAFAGRWLARARARAPQRRSKCCKQEAAQASAQERGPTGREEAFRRH